MAPCDCPPIIVAGRQLPGHRPGCETDRAYNRETAKASQDPAQRAAARRRLARTLADDGWGR